MYYLDKRIENLYRIFDQNERKDYLRLDLNENPSGLPQEFINEVLKEVMHALWGSILKLSILPKYWPSI